MRQSWLILLSLLVAGGSMGASMYKWVDEQGITHYADTPPMDRKAEERILPPPPPTPGGEQARQSLQQSREGQQFPPQPADLPSEEVVPPVSIERALEASPHALAQGYLWASDAVIYARLAGLSPNGTVHINVDGRAVTITQANAQAYLVGFEGRLNTYGKAIEQRGFPLVSGEYETRASRGCANLFPGQGTTRISQEGFKLEVTTGAVRHRAVIVESAVALEHGLDSDIIFLGEFKDRAATLVHAPSSCVVTMQRR